MHTWPTDGCRELGAKTLILRDMEAWDVAGDDSDEEVEVVGAIVAQHYRMG